MILGAPWGLLGLLAVPSILAIHLYRRRYRPRPVSGLFLYGLAPPSPAAGRHRQRLLLRPSLLLELLAALAATWFLSDPHLGARDRAHHLIAVLDDRARMQARAASNAPAFEAARDALDAQLAALDRDDRVTLVLSGAPARVLAGPEARPAEARAALSRWRPAAPSHDLEDALGLALDLAADDGDGDGLGASILLVSDRRPDSLPDGVGLIARGLRRPTSGLADARWLAADGARPERVALRVVAHGGLPRARQVVVTAPGGAPIARGRVDLAPGRAAGLTLPLPDGAPDTLEVTLLGDDPLPLDDRVTLVRPAPRGVTVRVTLPAAQAAPTLRALRAVEGVTLAAAAAPAELVIAGPAAPPPGDLPAGAWTLTLAPGQGPLALGPFLAARGHPLLRGVDLTGVVWAGAATAAEAAPDAHGILLAGDAILATEALRGRARDLTLHLDLSRSTVAAHPAWPALIANLIAARRDALPGPARANLPLGQAATVTLPAAAQRVILVAPSGQTAALAADRLGVALLPPLSEPGVHALRLPGARDGAPPWALVNGLLVDARLGDLRAAATLDVAPTEREAGGDVARRRGPAEHTLPLVVAALAALAAWWSYRREERPTAGATEAG